MKLILFGTSACHLCEQAHSVLQQVLTTYPHIRLEIVDIAEQPQWQAQYAIRIPVLLHPSSGRELGWFFDHAAVVAFIHELST